MRQVTLEERLKRVTDQIKEAKGWSRFGEEMGSRLEADLRQIMYSGECNLKEFNLREAKKQ